MSAKTGAPESSRIRHAWLRVSKQLASALFSQFPFVHLSLHRRASSVYSASWSRPLPASTQDAPTSAEPLISAPLLPRIEFEIFFDVQNPRTSVETSLSAAELPNPAGQPTSPSPRSRRRSHFSPIPGNTDPILPCDATVELESQSRPLRVIAKTGFPAVADGYSEFADEDHVLDPQLSQEHLNREMHKSETVSDRPRALKRHTMALWLVSTFAAVTIFAWTITCVLCYKPIQFRTYYDKTGRYTRRQYGDNDRWRTLSRVLMSLLSNVSIPVTSAICARAVAVYCQCCSKLPKPTLTMRQMLALADKGWTDTMVLSGLLIPCANKRMGSPLLILSALLCGLALLISFLQGALIDTISITVMTNGDVGPWGNTTLSEPDARLYKSVGTTLSKLNLDVYTYEVAEATVSGKISDQQPDLWLFDDSARNLTSFQAFYSEPVVLSTVDRLTTFSPQAFFTSSVPVGTDTGILQAVALRLNTSLNCEEVPHSEFPASCDGTSSFATSYSNADRPEARADYYGGPIFTFRACAPENSGWIAGKSRQEISEDLYMDLQFSRSPAEHNVYNAKIDTVASAVSNFSYHCTTNSMLAVFEPPNHWNGHQVHDVIDLGPQNAKHPTGPNSLLQPEIPSDPLTSPGPFLTSILAIFGNYTFFNDVIKANDMHDTNLDTCRALRMPLTGLCTGTAGMCTPYNYSFQGNTILNCITPGSNDPSEPNIDHQHPNGTLAFYLFLFLQKFNNLDSTIAALTLTNFYSSRAILDPSQGLDGHTFSSSFAPIGQIVYTSPGLDIQKVHIPLAGTLIITLLIILQLAGLFSLALYASHHATWTELLDSFALLRLGAAMADELPLISALEAKELAVLDEKEGWVGDAGEAGRVRLLSIGGEGCARRDAPYRSVDQGRAVRFKRGI